MSNGSSVTKIFETMKSVKTSSLKLETEKVALLQASVTEIKPLGLGARACIDMCDLMRYGEGLLVGCQSSGLFLIEAEVHETPFVAPRPFRVSAGPIALYILVPDGKTRYLSELKSGHEALIVNYQGRGRMANICRIKIEWRPLILIEAECEGKRIKTIVQNVETIRFITEEGSKPIKNLKLGDTVKVHIKAGGRHSGTPVREGVLER